MAKFVGTLEGPGENGATMRVSVSIPIDDSDFTAFLDYARRERAHVFVGIDPETNNTQWRDATLRESVELVLEGYFDRMDDDVDRSIRQAEREARRAEREHRKAERRASRRIRAVPDEAQIAPTPAPAAG